MRYHFKKPANYSAIFGKLYICNHPVYSRCTLYLIGKKGLAVIQQRHDRTRKITWWEEIDKCLVDAIFMNQKFKEFFDKRAGDCTDGLYPTVTVRQIMWALKMMPLRKERWETTFDRKDI